MRALLAAAVLCTGCSGGSASLAGDAGLETDWVEVELATGAVCGVPPPTAEALLGPRWRGSHMLFRRVPAGVAPAPAASLPGGGEPEDAAEPQPHALAYLAVFEMTAAQWVVFAAAAGTASDLPRTGVAADDVLAAIASRPLRRMRLDLPDADLWQDACAAGSPALFSWGDSTAAAVTMTCAVHQPADGGGPEGPAAVGGRTANAYGLHDMHGNAWELVRTGDGFAARGGAWDATILQCRTANLLAVGADLRHPSLGVRLALRP